VLSDLFCDVNGIWRKYECIFSKERTGQVIEILLNLLNMACLWDILCLVSIPARIVGVFTPASYGPLHVNRNWLDSFQTAQLGN
jgi:hypothetical protein